MIAPVVQAETEEPPWQGDSHPLERYTKFGKVAITVRAPYLFTNPSFFLYKTCWD